VAGVGSGDPSSSGDPYARSRFSVHVRTPSFDIACFIPAFFACLASHFSHPPASCCSPHALPPTPPLLPPYSPPTLPLLSPCCLLTSPSPLASPYLSLDTSLAQIQSWLSSFHDIPASTVSDDWEMGCLQNQSSLQPVDEQYAITVADGVRQILP
jgi:hypothetical protein